MNSKIHEVLYMHYAYMSYRLS